MNLRGSTPYGLRRYPRISQLRGGTGQSAKGKEADYLREGNVIGIPLQGQYH